MSDTSSNPSLDPELIYKVNLVLSDGRRAVSDGVEGDYPGRRVTFNGKARSGNILDFFPRDYRDQKFHDRDELDKSFAVSVIEGQWPAGHPLQIGAIEIAPRRMGPLRVSPMVFQLVWEAAGSLYDEGPLMTLTAKVDAKVSGRFNITDVYLQELSSAQPAILPLIVSIYERLRLIDERLRQFEQHLAIGFGLLLAIAIGLSVWLSR